MKLMHGLAVASFALVVVTSPCLAQGREGTSISLCAHPDDEKRGSQHVVEACGRKMQGHPFVLRDHRSSDCSDCEKAHSENPSLCKHKSVQCDGRSSTGSQSGEGYDPPVTSIRK